MGATLAGLVSHTGFGITTRVAGAPDTVIAWVHSSDLVDPSPFLAAGQALLTTGRQFPHDEQEDGFYEAYIDRLRRVGVVVVGFGTEVIRAGTPQGLLSACRRAGMPLVEVPYRTPFLAISQWVASIQSADARKRAEWASETQNAVSIAALGSDGISAAIKKTADLLGSSIWLFDADAEVAVTAHPSSQTHREVPEEVAEEVIRLLGARRRARVDLHTHTVFTTVQTLGGADSLTGALVLSRSEPFDPAALSVATTLVALAEVSVEHRQSLRISLRSLMDQLLALLRDGRVEQVRRAIEAIPAGIPRQDFRVVNVDLTASRPALRDALERQAAVPENRIFASGTAETLTLLVEPWRWPAVHTSLSRWGARAGVSDALSWEQLDVGLVQAARACERSRSGETTEFTALVSDSFLGLLASESVAEIARARLSTVLRLPGGRQLLTEASVWLNHNAQWDPAARELGIHRHSLKTRMAHLASLTELDLSRFQHRAELWALLSSINLTAP